MNTPSQTKRDTLILALIVLALLMGMVYFYLEFQLKKSIQEQFENISTSTENLFNINMKHDRETLNYTLDKIIMANGLSKAIADRDYEHIKSIITPYYNQLKLTEDAVNILTFRSNDGITLFRAHKPEYFGDMLNEKRTLIVDTNTLQRSFSGFEVGKLEMTFRVTKPIFYNNICVGNVEVGMTPTHFLKDLNTIFKTEIGIAIDKSLSDIMVNKSTMAIDEKYLLLSGSENLNMHFTHNHNEKRELYKVDMSIPLQNHLSQTLGYLVVGYDISDIIKKDTAFMYRLFFMILIMMLILGAVLMHGFNEMLKYFTRQVYTDHLTGLKNRYALNEALYSKKSHVLILSNIKEFSLFNELYGVNVGNEILLQVAKSFRSFALEYGFTAYRISSDEYVILKEEDTFEEDKYVDFIDKLHTKINSLKILVDEVDEVIGVELYSGVAFNHAHSLEDAQMALKKAKKQSLPYLMYSQQLDTKEYSQTTMKVKRTIRHALEHKNVIPFFQQITNVNGKIVKYEALIRIIDFESGEKKVLVPAEFLDVSMKSGLYIKMAIEMLEQSLAFFANRDEKISVNFLPNDFFNSSIMDSLIKGIENFDSPERIVVEITEQEGVENFERLSRVVKKLRNMGVLIAIDDFGSGYANYAHILELKPDYIKIDGSLIQNILTDSDSKILVKSIVRFAQELNITTVAEFVENEEIFELLKEYGVDEFQGYYFGRPTDLINKIK